MMVLTVGKAELSFWLRRVSLLLALAKKKGWRAAQNSLFFDPERQISEAAEREEAFCLGKRKRICCRFRRKFEIFLVFAAKSVEKRKSRQHTAV